MRFRYLVLVSTTLALVACGGDDTQSASGAPTASGGGATSGSGSPSGSGPAGPGAGGSTGGSGPGSASSVASSGAGGGTAGGGIASKYPGDVGIENDPQVIFAESFEEGAVPAVLAKWEDSKNAAGMTLVPDVPAKSAGAASMKLVAGGAKPATDFYTRLPGGGYGQLYVRYYAKYEGGIQWHHTSVWLGGYQPSTSYPNPQAGSKPNGDDRVSIAFEPVGQSAGTWRMDFYDYWMNMHSGAGTYYGNTLVNDKDLTLPADTWMCVEVMIKLNDDPSSAAGGELALWRDDALIVHFTESSPLGYWVQDKFCPEGADSKTCVDYAPPASDPKEPLDVQWRSTKSLELNWIWPQNYITEGPAGAVQYDDLVVASARIGCLQ